MALIPHGSYRGRVETAKILKSKKEGTAYFECECVVTEDVEYEGQDGKKHSTRGTRIPWNGWLSERSAKRSVDSLRASGCTFPGDNYEDFSGIGTKDVILVVETDEYEPPPTEENPSPKPTKRSRVAWVNETQRSFGVAMEDGEKKAFLAGLKNTVASGAASSDGSTVKGGTLRDKTGKELF
jgi:hypothetical protein